MEQELSTEQAILMAAEHEFLEKGFDRAKTVEIARLAGVTHAMLHYYFRTKEKLFDQVFQAKLKLLSESFLPIIGGNMSFHEKVRRAVEAHFDFIMANPKLPHFILNEIFGNTQRMEQCRGMMTPIIGGLISHLKLMIDAEAEKGTIKMINPIDLILNIVSLNVFVFVAHPLVQTQMRDGKEYQNFLEHRKQENVRLVLKGLERD